MRFDPKTEEQIASENLVPEGWYEAEVTAAVEEKSSKGNDMISLTLKLFVDDTTRQMRDWLLPAFPGKLKHFCDGAGLGDRYSAGLLKDEHCVGVLVMCEIKHKTQKTGEYAGQVQANVVDYKAVQRSSAVAKPASGKKPNFDPIKEDDIPF